MDNKPFNEIKSRDGFGNKFMIFMSVVMEGNGGTVIRIDTGSGNDRSAEIAPNILGHDRRITVIGLSIDIKSIAMIAIDSRFDYFESRPESIVKTIEKSGTKGTAKKRIIEVFNAFPRGKTANGDFGKKNMNMGIPLKAAAKGMENANETGSKLLRLIEFAKHAKNDITNGMKQAVEERTVFTEEDAKFFGNGEDAMSVDRLNNLERHGSRTLNRIEITARRAKATFAAERDKFERTARRTPVHSAAESRIATVDHFLNTFHDNGASFEGVLNFLIMV